VLERNPNYWKTDAKGNRLPYVNELVFLFVPNADAQVLKFQSGETDAIAQLGAENFSVLSRQQRGYTMVDAGPGLEYNFLFFNLNDLGEKDSPEMARKQKMVPRSEVPASGFGCSGPRSHRSVGLSGPWALRSGDLSRRGTAGGEMRSLPTRLVHSSGRAPF